jgi:hypothetical protein
MTYDPATRRSPVLSSALVAAAALTFAPGDAAALSSGEPPAEAPEFFRADPIPVPAEHLTPEALKDQDTEPLAAVSATLFVNFDGATLKGGNDNAPTNTTQMPSQYVLFNYPAYGDGPKRAATLQAVVKDWMPFNVLVTDKRPAGGAYHMCMTGPGKGGGLPNGVLGIAPLDCDDNQKSNVVYAFHTANDQFTAATQATTISQELAHAFGLEHVKEPQDIMNPYNAGADPTFMDQCIVIDGRGNGIVCGSQHVPYCGAQTSQNSYQELLGFFGASNPDVAPPTVSITYPMDGAIFEAGETFNLTINASDDQGDPTVDVYYNGGKVKTLLGPPYELELSNVQPANYSFYAIAIDGSSNMATSMTVNFTVVPASSTSTSTSTSGAETTGGGSSGGSGGSGDPTSGGEDDTGADDGGSGDSATQGDPALPPGYGQNDGEDFGACACRSDAPALSGAPLLLVVVALRRRRRG